MKANESYDEKLFVRPQSDHLKCPICLIIMKDPVLCPTESCSFCRHCVSDHLNRDETCPNCRNPLTKQQLRPNRLICSLIGDAEVFCFSRDASQKVEIKPAKVCVFGSQKDKTRAKKTGELSEVCDWSGKLQEAQRHYDQCPFAKIDCPHIGCDDIILRKSLPEHTENCLHRQIICTFCKQRKKIDSIEAHLLDCPERPVPCPNGCLNMKGDIVCVSPSSIPSHRGVCPMELIDCKFVGVGCEIKLLRKDMPLHENDAGAHIGCLLSKINKLEKFIQTLSGDNEIKNLVLKVPVSQLDSRIRSRIITISGHSFHFHIFPNPDNIGWHSWYLTLVKIADQVDFIDVKAVFEVVSYEENHLAKKRTLMHMFKLGEQWGYRDYIETAVLKSEIYGDYGQVTFNVKIAITS